MSGYLAAGGTVNEKRLRAYEHLWLLRCYNFECSMEAESHQAEATDSWRPLYPDAGYYRDLLQDL
jgi:hypothetical protein